MHFYQFELSTVAFGIMATLCNLIAIYKAEFQMLSTSRVGEVNLKIEFIATGQHQKPLENVRCLTTTVNYIISPDN